MPRIEPLPRRRAGLLTRLALRYAEASYGRLPEPVAVWAHAPAVFWTWSIAESLTARTWRRVPPPMAHLVALRAASVVGCPWCLDFASQLAGSHGVSAEQLREVHRWSDSAAFDDRERLALTYADGMTATPMTVTDELVDRLRAVFGDDQLVELTALIALENQRARFNHALGVEAQGFTKGACVLPAAGVQ